MESVHSSAYIRSALTPEVMEVEQGFTFNVTEKRQWMANHWHWSVVAAVAYIVLIHLAQQIMRKSEPFSLKPYLVIWNTGLAVFSMTGAWCVIPELLQTVRNQGLKASICSEGAQSEGVTGYWAWLFGLSKLPELFDTAFLVLRKRPVIFLHAYHHASVLVITWYQYQFVISALRWGVCMNYFVHALMYTYYAVRAYGYPLSRHTAMVVTVIQILQMIAGGAVSAAVFWETHFVNFAECAHNPTTASLQVTMYATYLFLFVGFFRDSYFGEKSRSTAYEKKLD